MAPAAQPLKPLRIQVPGSTSNVGTGFDAFSVALDLPIKISWSPAAKTSLTRKGPLAESTLSIGQDPVLRGLRRASILTGKRIPIGSITVEGSFPPGRGLGASGAGLAAGLLLGNRLLGSPLTTDALLTEAIGLEGHPENATASFLGGAHWSAEKSKGEWLHHGVTLHKNLRFLVVIPPYPLSTKRAREVLPSSVSFARAAAQARRSPLLLDGLRTLNADLIQLGLNDELHVAPRLRLLTGAQSVLDFSLRHGALGATLSGAGSALLVLTQTGRIQNLEMKLARHVKRLWGENGSVLSARVALKGPLISN
jgi:homoserine kinase